MEPDDPVPTPRPKSRPAYSGAKPASYEDREDADMPAPGGTAKKKAAIALMQEAKALEIGRHYVEARRKYIEAARLNASFGRDEDTPEAELARLDIAAGRKINAWIEDARMCIERRDRTTALRHLDEAYALATGMSLDASTIVDLRMSLRQSNTRPASRSRTDDVPMPIIRNGHQSIGGNNPPIRTVAGNEGPEPIPPAKTENHSKVIHPMAPAKPERIGKGPSGLPEVPDIDIDAKSIKPPMTAGAGKVDSERGQQLLKMARTELKKGDTEAARKIAVELINGPYGVKKEAVALLNSVETAESARKMDSARRAFENGMEAFESYHYAQALAIFQEIDGTLLPAESRKKLIGMIKIASAKKKEMDAAIAARNGGKAPPPPPMPAVGIPAIGPTPTPRTGSDSLVKQQEALAQVEFQRLRSKSLRVESEATNRFGRGETDAALQDLENYIAEVKSSPLDPAKQNLLVRPIEARMERLKILKHQTDFLTKEAKDRRDFTAGLTQEALYKEKKQEETAKLIRAANKLMDEAKYKEAYVQLQKAQSLDVDDPAVNATMMMAQRMWRLAEDRKISQDVERGNYEMLQGIARYQRGNREGDDQILERPGNAAAS